jgi:hypothetical protein
VNDGLVLVDDEVFAVCEQRTLIPMPAMPCDSLPQWIVFTMMPFAMASLQLCFESIGPCVKGSLPAMKTAL